MPDIRATLITIVLMVGACAPDIHPVPELVLTPAVSQCSQGRLFAEWKVRFELPDANPLDPLEHQSVVDNFNKMYPPSNYDPAMVYIFVRPSVGNALIFFVDASGLCVELAYPTSWATAREWMKPPKPSGISVRKT